MSDVTERIAALSPAKRELLLQKLRDRRTESSPAADAVDESGDEQQRPRTAAEEVLSELWVDLLGVDRVGVNDDFFKRGGHSLLATQLAARIPQAFGVEMPVEVIFQSPTIAKLASYIEAGSAGAEIPPIETAPRDQAIPLSYSQERVWFLHQMNPHSTAYHVPRCIEIRGALDVDALERAFNEIVRRHEILRTAFPSVEGRPVQDIRPHTRLVIGRHDYTHVAAEEDHRPAVDRFWRSEGQRPFDLANGGLLRVDLLKFTDQKFYLTIIEHHLVHDGWTQGVLFRELIGLYNAFSQGDPSPLPQLPIQFADYAVWQRQWLEGPAGQAQLKFWKEQLAGLPPVLGLPLDKPRPAVQSHAGDQEIVMIPAPLAQRLRALARGEGVTLFMVLLATFKVLLARYARTTDIFVGSGIANRRRKELETLMGMVVNNIVLRTDLSGDPTFRELLARVRKSSLSAYAHQDVPFEKVVQAVRPTRTLSHSPLFQVMFSFHDSPAPRLQMNGVDLRMRDLKATSAKFDLNVIALPYREQRGGGDGDPAGRRIWTSWEYSTDIFGAATIKGMARHFLRLLEGAVAAPGRRISELPLLAEEERQQVLALSGAADAPVRGDCLHDLFRQQAERTPDAVAAVCEDQQLTYGELDVQSDRLARRLRALGVGPETVVGLCMHRSLDMVIGILAILKSGGAYLPLDPEYPHERLAFMLSDVKAPVVVTHSRLSERIRDMGAAVLLIDDDEAAEQHDGGAVVAASPQNLAYVMYTSGSTGRPKGVMITHACVARLFSTTEDLFGFSAADVWSLFHSYAFDFSVWELWGALLYGGRVVVVPRAVRRAPDAFFALLEREGVTILNQTPSAFGQLMRVEAKSGQKLRLRTVILGGEALKFAELRPWLARHGDGSPTLVNMYGITETTVHVTHRPIAAADCEGTPKSLIGRGLDDLKLYVLDAGMEPVPLGVPGELHVGGTGLARGYFGRPNLTAERFVPNPFSAGERLYRTGDLVRWRSDGELEYLGRTDAQVKLRGFRIELGEVQATLSAHASVREALVLARDDRGAGKRIVGYVVLNKDGDAPPEPNDLKDHLRRSLPEYMIPAAIVPLESFPLTANGKVDRAALPRPSTNQQSQAYVAPRTRVEEGLAGIWSELLRVERVGVHDDFFDLGGHSLMGMRMMTRVQDAFGVKLPLRTLFEARTIDDMAKLIGKTEWDEVSISLAESA